jgi:hypothetical protein
MYVDLEDRERDERITLKWISARSTARIEVG